MNQEIEQEFKGVTNKEQRVEAQAQVFRKKTLKRVGMVRLCFW